MVVPISRRGDDSHDPVLAKVASTNTFDSDWPTLRHHLHVALLSTLPLFLSIGPPRPYRPPQPFSPPALVGASSPIKPDEDLPPQDDAEGEKPISESLLLSPSQPVSQIDSSTPGAAGRITPRSVDAEPTGTPSRSRLDSLSSDDFQPSTPGGMVIAAFPPLDRNRRRRSSASSTSSAGEAGPSTAGASLGGPGPSPRVNGLGAAQHLRSSAVGVFDDEWDEDVAIGGKKMPAWLEEDEGKKELDRLAGVLEEMEVAPFTIQRLSELLLEPTQYHKTLGKFLRAVEKTLLVTSPWEPPTYNPTTFTAATGGLAGRSTFGSTSSASSASSASSDNGYDSDSTMPPGASTPMFVPIPFMSPQEDMGSLPSDSGGGGFERSLDDGLMSPLLLSGEGGSDESSFAAVPSVRSPTPEPEDVEPSLIGDVGRPEDADAEMAETENVEPTGGESAEEEAKSPIARPPNPQTNFLSTPPSTTTTSEHSDPGHQSYLGRVDELDTGPITPAQPISTSTSPSSPSTNGHANGRGRDEELVVPGTGESGTMAPHGMSDKPIPLSSTTVVCDSSQRPIAALPRSASEKSLGERFVSEKDGEEETESKAE